jgi:hypothetical protein
MKAINYARRLTAGLIFVLPTLSLAQGTLIITFDGPPLQPPNSQYGVTSYSESGMLFLPGPSDFDGQFERNNNAGGAPAYPVDGGTYLQTGYGESLEFSFSSGSLFGLAAVDLAAYSTLIPNYTMDFVGYLSNGSTISTSFSGIGINFQTFDFGPEWSSGLTQVEIPNAPWSLDNFVVAVPEPEGGALGSVSAITFMAYQFKRKKRL